MFHGSVRMSLTGQNEALLCCHGSPPSGRVVKVTLFGAKRGRARRELDKALHHIFARLEHLEATPSSHLDLQDLATRLDAFRVGLDERLGGVETRFDALESVIEEQATKIKLLTFGVEEGIQRTSRAERRIHATVKRARKELAEHGYESPGLEVEAETLRLVDGGRSAESEVPKLPTGVEPPVEEASSINGVSAEELRRVRGF